MPPFQLPTDRDSMKHRSLQQNKDRLGLDTLEKRFKEYEIRDKRNISIGVALSNKLKTILPESEETEVLSNPYVSVNRNDKKIISMMFIGSKYDCKAHNKYKHYVNLPQNGNNDGRTIKIRVNTKNIKDGDDIYWRITASDNNSTRNDPILGIVENDNTTPFSDNIIISKTKVNNNISVLTLVCGIAGGDSFNLEVGVKESKYTMNTTLVNWRKVCVQLSYLKDFSFLGKDSLDFKYIQEVFNESYIEVDTTKPIEFTKDSLSNPNRIIKNSGNFKLDKSKNDYVVLTYKNHKPIIEMFKPNVNDTLQYNVIIGNEVRKVNSDYDSTYIDFKSTKVISAEYDVIPSLGDECIDYDESCWYVEAWTPNGVPTSPEEFYENNIDGRKVIPGPYEGKLTKEMLYVDPDRDDLNDLTVNLPPEALRFLPNDPSHHNLYDILGFNTNTCYEHNYRICLQIVYNGYEEYCGVAGDNIIMSTNTDTYTELNNTFIHELCHKLNLVPSISESAPGLLPHSNHYESQGGHCSYESDNDEKCIMYDSVPTKSLNKLCPECNEHLRANELSTNTGT